ncbi:MAG: hypothetical protein ACK40G_14545 [Cytophagaceae bacterium]
MIKIKFRFVWLILFILIIISGKDVFSQGCSDAGFCTIGGIKPITDSTTKGGSQIKLGAFYGKADNSVVVWGNYLEYIYSFSNRFRVDIKLTTLGQTGNNINTFGLGDVFLIGNYKMDNKIRIILGSKIPLTNANRKINNISLPMDYQSSLGTIDLIGGLGYEIKGLQLMLAFQQPLTQNNNEFIAEDYPIDFPLRNFQSTKNYIRSGDILLRMSYPVKLTNKFKVTPGLLPIYHISDDRFTDSAGIQREIKGSQGLTLNGNFFIDYIINDNNSFQFNIGTPFLARKARPDGLTRSLIVSLEYRLRF